jgi:hypothetical protein
MSPAELEAGYWRAYRDFYSWRNIVAGASTKDTLGAGLRHAAYSAGWKKFEPLWDLLIRARNVARALPILETVLGATALVPEEGIEQLALQWREPIGRGGRHSATPRSGTARSRGGCRGVAARAARPRRPPPA